MNIIICQQGLFGGTDKLLSRLFDWLNNNGYFANMVCVEKIESLKVKDHYEMAIIPSSQIGDLYTLFGKGIIIDRTLIWIMGMGAFTDAYYNYPPISVFDKILYAKYKKESRETLKWLINNDSIVFTDAVGIYNTIKVGCYGMKSNLEKSIVPIAIDVPKKNQWIEKRNNHFENILRISWIGRVSSDFKKIPICHLIDDLQAQIKKNNISIELTIVGDGDAVQSIKDKLEKVYYETRYIKNIPYQDLDNYLANQVDLLVAMGTSALDGAKIGCPTIVITPVRENDPQRVEYRWIYESVGYSLGEFPNIDIETGQCRHDFNETLNKYLDGNPIEISKHCFEYAQKFDRNIVFNKLIHRKLPGEIDKDMKKHIEKFYKMKKNKEFIKKILRRI